jgi:hypothetical protein
MVMAHSTLPETSDKFASTESHVSRAQLLRFIADAIDDGLPEPIHVHLNIYSHTTTTTVELTLRLPNNDAAGVAAWAHTMNIPVKISGLYDESSPRKSWRCHEAEGAVWHGWQFRVWSVVDEPEGAGS